MSRRSLTVRVARWSAIHPWRAMGLWLVFVAACLTAGSVTGTRQADAAADLGESSRAQAIIDSGHFGPPAAAENVLITARSGAFDPAAAARAAQTVTTRMSALPQVAAVDPPAAAPNGDGLLVRVTLAGAPDAAGVSLAPLQAATAAVQTEYPSLRVEQIGDTSISQALDAIVDRDFQRAELVSIPLTLVILVVMFGALIAAGVPVVLALSAVAAAIG